MKAILTRYRGAINTSAWDRHASKIESRAAWLRLAQARLECTRAELSLSTPDWEVVHGRPHPGEGYTEVLRVQARRLERDIAAAEAAKEAT